MEKQISALNQLRKSVSNVSVKAGTLNQAWKALNGAMTAAEQEALGLENMSFKALMNAWAPELKKQVDGKDVVCLYIPQTVTFKVSDGKGGTKDVNVFERTVNKKGEVTFKALKRRELDQPKAWTPALIVEALCQSRFVGLAQQEAVESMTYVAEQVQAGNTYKKVVAKDKEAGTSAITFEKMESQL